jgi:hypothetical protein
MQTTIATKTQLLATANHSIEDLTLKLTTLSETLDGARKREETLTKDLQKERDLLQSAAVAQNKFRENVKLFTERLADAAAGIDKELTAMGV